jgi:hypothetical protein
MVHFAGSRAGPTIFQLPTNFPEFGISILVMILRGDGTETFREVSNKEPYLVNEGGMVFKYLSGNEEYGGSYQGFDLDGKIVPLNI